MAATVPQPPASGGVKLLNVTTEPSAGVETEQPRKNNWSLSAYQESAEGWALPPATTKKFLLPLQISAGIDRRSWETSARSLADRWASLLRCGICVLGLPCEPGKKEKNENQRQSEASGCSCDAAETWRRATGGMTAGACLQDCHTAWGTGMSSRNTHGTRWAGGFRILLQ